MMINGDGFFVVKNKGEQMYIRAGAFSFDADGRLVNNSGMVMQGWGVDAARRGRHQAWCRTTSCCRSARCVQPKETDRGRRSPATCPATPTGGTEITTSITHLRPGRCRADRCP